MILRVKVKPLLANIAIPLGVGTLAALLSAQGQKEYIALDTKPALTPPEWLFPVVWTVLFILMGISAYLVWKSKMPQRKNALTVYGIQLALNFAWPLVFFCAKAYFPAFITLILLWVCVAVMIYLFCKVRPLSGLLQIPYILWLTFAGYLNYATYMMN